MYARVIWDWNGTLLDDAELCRRTVNGLLAEHGHPPLTRARYREVFGFPIKDYYRRAGFDFAKEPYPPLARAYMARYVPASLACRLAPGARRALRFFRGRGVPQTVLTVSDTGTLSAQMDRLRVRGFFEEIIGQDNIYAHGKEELAREWAARSGEDPKRVLLIGDTLHDGEIARQIGCACVLVARGHQSAARLAAAGFPVFADLKAFLAAEEEK